MNFLIYFCIQTDLLAKKFSQILGPYTALGPCAELSLPAGKIPGLVRRPSEVGRAVSDPGRHQTSECR